MENRGQFDSFNLMFQIPRNGHLSTVGHENIRTFTVEEHYFKISLIK